MSCDSAFVPHMTSLLRGDEDVLREICQAPPPHAAAGTPNLCGTKVVVTLLRLASGATILPHCGVTNR